MNARISLDSVLADRQRFRGRSLYWFYRGVLSIHRTIRSVACLPDQSDQHRFSGYQSLIGGMRLWLADVVERNETVFVPP